MRTFVPTMILLLGMWQAAAAKPADPTLSELLKRQTQELSDAGQNGDRAVLDRYIDDDAALTDEDGSIATKADTLAAAHGQTKSGQSITVTEWALRVQGLVATATFVDELKQTLFGQNLDFKFRSTETWLHKAQGWQLISSQTTSLLEDPKAVRLSQTELVDYVGHYRAGPGADVTVAVKDGKLVASPAGSSAVIWEAEARDVFFTPGQPRGRKVFQRDANGHITGYASRREGRDVVLQKVG